jgi:hypothetical protein
MSWTKRGLAPAFGAVMLGLAACSEGGCAHELPVTVAPTDTIMTVEQLEDLIWPDTKDRWNPVPERELVALEKLVVALLERAEAGYLGAAQVGRFQRLIAEAGLELRVVEVQLPAGEGMRSVETLWVLIEAADDRRGRGTYVFRIGALEPRRRGRVEHVLQAPHSRFDKYSGTIALGLFVERDVGVQPPRALFVNSTHRYRQFDGSRVRLVPATRNPADAAHRTDHPLARATASALRERPIAVVQLHGFERNFEIGDPELIVSSGVPRPSKTSAATRDRLREAFPDSSVAHYGVDANRLGGETNVQGRAARTERRCFIHIETCESLRQQLRSDREARRRFAAAVFGADGEELSGGCK